MIAVVQRVSKASVNVQQDAYQASIERGLCVLLGVEEGDCDRDASWMASKLARLRIFPDEAGLMNRSVQDIAGHILLISQFTLAGDCSRGNRPSFVRAAKPDLGRSLYDAVGALLERAHGLPVRRGVFGAMMNVSLVNDGPVTIILRSRADPA